MIKGILFDLDGVLIDAKDWHYEALNNALMKFDCSPIDRQEHLSTFDGLPTRTKLDILTEKGRVPKEMHDSIYNEKQKLTMKYVQDKTKPVKKHIEALKKLKKDGYILAVCSNAIRPSVKTMLENAGIIDYFKFYLSNEDVNNPKPNPEIYLKAANKLGLKKDECLAIEDNEKGFKSVNSAGVNLMKVKTVHDVYYENIKNNIERVENMINVVIPMAGEGSRFKKKGYDTPKPFIDVNGKPMIERVIESINIPNKRLILIVRESHYDEYKKYLEKIVGENDLLIPALPEEGAVCSVLFSHYHTNNKNPMIIANCDQILDFDMNNVIQDVEDKELDGSILTFQEDEGSRKWSYAKVVNGKVTSVREKVPISNQATIGVYYFSRGEDFVNASIDMIIRNERVNNEFYVCPVYNYLIKRGKDIGVFDVSGKWDSVGTPELLNNYLNK